MQNLKIRKSLYTVLVGVLSKEDKFKIMLSEETKEGTSRSELWVHLSTKFACPLETWKELVQAVEELEKEM